MGSNWLTGQSGVFPVWLALYGGETQKSRHIGKNIGCRGVPDGIDDGISARAVLKWLAFGVFLESSDLFSDAVC
jgi:hypothetical protein